MPSPPLWKPTRVGRQEAGKSVAERWGSLRGEKVEKG